MGSTSQRCVCNGDQGWDNITTHFVMIWDLKGQQWNTPVKLEGCSCFGCDSVGWMGYWRIDPTLFIWGWSEAAEEDDEIRGVVVIEWSCYDCAWSIPLENPSLILDDEYRIYVHAILSSKLSSCITCDLAQGIMALLSCMNDLEVLPSGSCISYPSQNGSSTLAHLNSVINSMHQESVGPSGLNLLGYVIISGLILNGKSCLGLQSLYPADNTKSSLLINFCISSIYTTYQLAGYKSEVVLANSLWANISFMLHTV